HASAAAGSRQRTAGSAARERDHRSRLSFSDSNTRWRETAALRVGEVADAFSAFSRVGPAGSARACARSGTRLMPEGGPDAAGPANCKHGASPSDWIMNMDIDFPFHFDSRGRTATADESDHIRDMIEQLIFTNPGERVNRPDFGSGLLQLIFAPNSN